MIHRRTFIATVACGLLAAPLAAGAQQPVVLVGILASGSSRSAPLIGDFVERLRELGFVEGRNLTIEFRTAEGSVDRLPGLAAELVQLKAHVILAPTAPAVRAVKEVSSTIPIVTIATDYDPIAAGYVLALGRPGANVTGLSLRQVELTGKRLSLLKEALPGISRVAALWDAFSADQLRTAEATARSLGLQLQPLELRSPPYDFEGALGKAARGRAEALLGLAFPLMYRDRNRVAAAVLKNRLPGMFPFREIADAGGLMAYGANLSEMYRSAAEYVGKILNGAKPADLPVEQPTKFELVINLKTAKALGLTISPSLLQRADQLIE
jgi:putative tryptophan/tyrosine transport system substrate-binding protein